LAHDLFLPGRLNWRPQPLGSSVHQQVDVPPQASAWAGWEPLRAPICQRYEPPCYLRGYMPPVLCIAALDRLWSYFGGSPTRLSLHITGHAPTLEVAKADLASRYGTRRQKLVAEIEPVI
jgi:hypothetical protein